MEQTGKNSPTRERLRSCRIVWSVPVPEGRVALGVRKNFIYNYSKENIGQGREGGVRWALRPIPTETILGSHEIHCCSNTMFL